MLLKKKLKILSFILIIIFSNFTNLIAFENKILFKVENEIITTIDIYEEIKFLKSFNPNIQNFKKTELFEISKNSILRDRIKKIEIMNFVKELKVDDRFIIQLIKNKYSNIDINSLENFENYLRDNNLSIKNIKEKFYIQIIWNDLIFQKFQDKVIIDREKIKNKILLDTQKEHQRELLLSEITFNVNDKKDFQDKYEKILSDIKAIGFKKAAIATNTAASPTKL